jgi:hypothetical protein
MGSYERKRLSFSLLPMRRSLGSVGLAATLIALVFVTAGARLSLATLDAGIAELSKHSAGDPPDTEARFARP